VTTGAEPDRTGQGQGGDTALSGDVAFRLLVDAVVDYAIFLLSPDGTVLTWNLGAQRIKGYEADEIVGRHFSQFYTPEDREAGRPQKVLELATSSGRYEDEGWRMRKDGSRFWADVVITALQEAPGAPPHAFVKITRDLTERRAAEDQRRRLEAEQRARAAAEGALAVRDRFLSVASHELKTPVASLQISTEALLRAREHDDLDDARLERGLRRIATASERLGELVSELLDVSRLSAEPREPRRQPTDIAGLVRDVAARFEEMGNVKRIRISAPGSVPIEVDGSRLEQVISNLLDNALKYSEPDAPVEVELADSEDRVVINVSDRGIGVDEETPERLFEAFGRGSNAEHLQGIGLGLYISRQIVQRHGGQIEASRRRDGPGSTFTVTLPRVEGGP